MADDLDVDNWEHLRFADTDELPALDDELLAALDAELAAEESADAEDPAPAADEPEPELAAAEPDDDQEHSGELAQVTELAPKSAEKPAAGADDDGADHTDGASAVVVHSRMRHRRIAVKREEGQRRLTKLAWALGGLALLVDGAAFVQTSFVDVEKIDVAGTARSDPDTVTWASGVDLGDATLTIDEQAAEDRIEELAWIASADVQKDWPSTVRVRVTERVPAAVLESSPGAPRALVDATGRVLEIGGEIPYGLVTVTGVPPVLREGGQVPEETRDALKIAVAAPQRVPGAVTSVNTRLEAVLTSGGKVRFGSIEDLDEKLVAVATALARVDLRGLCVLDVKAPGSLTVSRQPC